MQRLNSLLEGEQAKVLCYDKKIKIRRRLLDMGLIEGTKVKCVLKSPAGDPKAYLIRGAVIALRNEDTKNIYISKGRK